MKKGTDNIFIQEAVNFLKLATDQYNVLPHKIIMKIEEITKELEEILEEIK
jgi:hypothetical protein